MNEQIRAVMQEVDEALGRVSQDLLSTPKAATDHLPEFSDEALALRFASQHANDLRYVAEWSRWIIWNGQKWVPDGTLFAFDQARAIGCAAGATCGQPKSCPLWCEFISCINAGDATLQEFLQRMTGYALTGITREQALFFGHGTGANGKSVFTGTISSIMADYHCAAPLGRKSHQDADRRGEGEGALYASKPVRVCATTELLITGNHKPGLQSVDEAMRRRFNLIPFNVTIAPEKRDRDLTEKLKKEWSGILA